MQIVSRFLDRYKLYLKSRTRIFCIHGWLICRLVIHRNNNMSKKRVTKDVSFSDREGKKAKVKNAFSKMFERSKITYYILIVNDLINDEVKLFAYTSMEQAKEEKACLVETYYEENEGEGEDCDLDEKEDEMEGWDDPIYFDIQETNVSEGAFSLYCIVKHTFFFECGCEIYKVFPDKDTAGSTLTKLIQENHNRVCENHDATLSAKSCLRDHALNNGSEYYELHDCEIKKQ